MTARCRGSLFVLGAALCGGALGTAENVLQAPEQLRTADAKIQANLETVFAQVPSFGDVDVRVRSGVVTLEGTTLNAAARDDALELARNVDGVLYVVDDLEQEADLGRTLTPALARLRRDGR